MTSFPRLPALLLAAVVLLPACSAVEQKRLEYRHSQSIAPLQIPAGLDTPASDAALPLPQVNAAQVEVDVTPPVNLPAELLAAPESESPASDTD